MVWGCKLNLILILFGLASVWGVIRSENTIQGLVFVILVFFGASISILSIEIDFFCALFILVYVGAIAILFLFVLMILDLKFSQHQVLNKLDIIFYIFCLFWSICLCLNWEYVFENFAFSSLNYNIYYDFYLPFSYQTYFISYFILDEGIAQNGGMYDWVLPYGSTYKWIFLCNMFGICNLGYKWEIFYNLGQNIEYFFLFFFDIINFANSSETNTPWFSYHSDIRGTGSSISHDYIISAEMDWHSSVLNNVSNILGLGQIFYTYYFIYFLLGGFVLLLGLIGAIGLTKSDSKQEQGRIQILSRQLSRRSEWAVYRLD